MYPIVKFIDLKAALSCINFFEITKSGLEHMS